MDELRSQNAQLMEQLSGLQRSLEALNAQIVELNNQLQSKDRTIQQLTTLVAAQANACSVESDVMEQEYSDDSSSTTSSESEDDLPAPAAPPAAPSAASITPPAAPSAPSISPPAAHTSTKQVDKDGFVTVSHHNKRRRPSTPDSTPVALKKGKKQSSPTTAPVTNNKITKIDMPKPTVVNKTVIPSIDNIDAMGDYASNPPAITIINKKQWETISHQLSKLHVHIVKAKYFPDCMKFIVQKPNQYRVAVKYLSNNNIQFYTHPLNEEKDIRVVIRNVDTSISDESVIQQLKTINLPVLSVRRMGNSTRLFPMVSVHLENSQEGRQIYNLAKISHATVSVEKQKPSNRQPQCHKCQRFGHSSQRCNVAARCVKCAGPHLTAQCTRKNPETDGPPTCCNCGEAHTANYRGCTKYPKPSYASITKPAPQAVKPQAPKATPPPPKTNKPTPKQAPSKTPSPQKGNITQDLIDPKFIAIIERLEKLAPLISSIKSLI